MNLFEILNARVTSTGEGDHAAGLRAVAQHILIAGKHLHRGQTENEESAFTDAIYRTNQAFEGSMKEAYRVLAQQDPLRTTPARIEEYLQQQNILRPRVLAQLKNYRQEWRNPSTHDYRLDFDEDEALFAIVTAYTFAIVLSDQILEKLSFLKAQTESTTSPLTPETELLRDRISILLAQYTIEFNKNHSKRFNIRGSELAGALAGFLSKAAPDISVELPSNSSDAGVERSDFMLKTKSESLMVELKRTKPSQENIEQAALQMTSYIEPLDIDGLVYFYYSHNNGSIKKIDYDLHNSRKVLVVFTQPEN